MATRLQIYNNALQVLGQPFIASLTENTRSRRELDQAWDSGAPDYCLEQGQWQFALRTEKIEPDPDTDTQFGFANAFNKPIDWILTSALCSDERFDTPLLAYTDETDFWFADITPIYVKYVSNDDNYGNNLARWPTTFQDYVATYLAGKVCLSVGAGSEMLSALMKPKDGLLAIALTKARSRAAMTQPTRFAARGSWVNARNGRSNGYRDRGNPGSLIG